MKFVTDGNWGLKLLALVLAIVTYHALKNNAGTDGNTSTKDNERSFFQYR